MSQFEPQTWAKSVDEISRQMENTLITVFCIAEFSNDVTLTEKIGKILMVRK